MTDSPVIEIPPASILESFENKLRDWKKWRSFPKKTAYCKGKLNVPDEILQLPLEHHLIQQILVHLNAVMSTNQFEDESIWDRQWRLVLQSVNEEFFLKEGVLEKIGNHEVRNTGTTILHGAIDSDYESLAAFLLEKGEIDVNTQSGFIKETPLQIAIRAKNAQLVRVLLERGADPHLKCVSGRSALQYAIFDVRRLNLDIIKMLLKKFEGKESINDKDCADSSAFFNLVTHISRQSLQTSHPDHVFYVEVIKAFLEHPQSIHAKGPEEQGVLHIDAPIDIQELLIKAGADINARDALDRTPLFLAADRDSSSVELLLKHKADVDTQAENGQTALHIAVINQVRQPTLRQLLCGARNFYIQDNEGNTFLHYACKSKKRSMINYFSFILECITLNVTLREVASTIMLELFALKNKEGQTPYDLVMSSEDITPKEKGDVRDFGRNLIKTQAEKMIYYSQFFPRIHSALSIPGSEEGLSFEKPTDVLFRKKPT